MSSEGNSVGGLEGLRAWGREGLGAWARCGVLVAVALVFSLVAMPARATVFYARDEALKLAFPNVERTEARDLFLSAEQRATIEKRAHLSLESDLLTIYVGHNGERVTGYAIFDTRVVRTLPETLMVVLSPEGKVDAVHLLAFYEPMEYRASDHWLAQFKGKSPEDDLALGRGIAGITGSTLTSNSVAASVRRALAIYTTLLKAD